VRRLCEWLASNSRNSGSRVVLAVDVGGPVQVRVDRAASLVSSLRERVVAVKVNWHLLLPFGVLGLRDLVDRCADGGLPVIADMKLNDIGSTNSEAAQILFENGFDAVIANPFVGYKEAMEDLLAESKRAGKGVLMLVYMSHEGAKDGYGLRVGGEPLYQTFARRTREWAADGAIVSSKSLGIIREVRSALDKDQVILSPGVGVQGGDAREALEAGSDYVIVGRAVVNAKDPVRAVESLNREVSAVEA
jgi:orotidine-5'-phosphate decarboxylase